MNFVKGFIFSALIASAAVLLGLSALADQIDQKIMILAGM